MAPLILLGTTSKYRRALFNQHFSHLSVQLAAPDIDERAVVVPQKTKVDGSTSPPVARDRSDARALTLAIAHAKADALLDTLRALPPDTLLLTSDQVVLGPDGEIREKPVDEAECRTFLRSYANAPVFTVAGVVVVRARDSERWEGVDIAAQYFSDMPEAVIDALIAKGDVMYCAGGITVEDDLLAPYRAKREGELESIMGLPVALVRRLLTEAGAPPGPLS